MATWTNLTYPFGSLLTSTKMTQLDANLDALAEGASGAPSIDEAAMTLLERKIVEIGPWNMDGAPSINVAHGLTYDDIRYTTVLIRIDGDADRRPLNYLTDGHIVIDSTNVILTRIASGIFDNTSFDSTTDPANRGWIIVWYVP